MKKSLTKIALHMDMLRSTFLACEILLVILRTICAVDAAVSAGISADLEKKMHVSFIIRFFQIHDPEVRTLSHSGVALLSPVKSQLTQTVLKCALPKKLSIRNQVAFIVLGHISQSWLKIVDWKPNESFLGTSMGVSFFFVFFADESYNII